MSKRKLESEDHDDPERKLKRSDVTDETVTSGDGGERHDDVSDVKTMEGNDQGQNDVDDVEGKEVVTSSSNDDEVTTDVKDCNNDVGHDDDDDDGNTSCDVNGKEEDVTSTACDDVTAENDVVDSTAAEPVNGTTAASLDTKDGGRGYSERKRKKVVFNGVRVYYFARSQGFTCVPSQGGSTLGMDERHSHIEDFSIKDYARQQRQLHKIIIEEHKRLGKLPRTIKKPKQENQTTENETESEESELEVDDYYFLQPLSTRQRRLLLRACGVKKIEATEKDECRGIRLSREMCGCTCKMFCDPRSCSCALAGIKCQVDRLSFPCGCSGQQSCRNPSGRIEFNPQRVRTHFLHTLMRLDLEQKSTSRTVPSEFNSNERGSCRDCQITDATGETAAVRPMEPLPTAETAQEFTAMESDSCSDQSSENEHYNEENSCLYKLDMVPGISEMLTPINYPQQNYLQTVQGDVEVKSSDAMVPVNGQNVGTSMDRGLGHVGGHVTQTMSTEMTSSMPRNEPYPTMNPQAHGSNMLDMSGCWSSENYCYNQQLASIIENGSCYGPELLQSTPGAEVQQNTVPILNTIPDLSKQKFGGDVHEMHNGTDEVSSSSGNGGHFESLFVNEDSQVQEQAREGAAVLPQVAEETGSSDEGSTVGPCSAAIIKKAIIETVLA